jgi:hypothetical protein
MEIMKIVDASFTADHLRYEKALLLDWRQKELPESAGS